MIAKERADLVGISTYVPSQVERSTVYQIQTDTLYPFLTGEGYL